MITLLCDVCRSKLGPADTALKIKAGAMKGREVHLCEAHTKGLIALLSPAVGKPADQPVPAPKPTKGRKPATRKPDRPLAPPTGPAAA